MSGARAVGGSTSVLGLDQEQLAGVLRVCAWLRRLLLAASRPAPVAAPAALGAGLVAAALTLRAVLPGLPTTPAAARSTTGLAGVLVTVRNGLPVVMAVTARPP